MKRLALSVCLLVLGCGADSPPAGTDSKPDDPGSSARYAGRHAAEKLLQRALVAPSTADYPWESVKSVEIEPIEGKRAWLVTGAVDSQNSFGAMVRGQWEVIEVLWDDEWTPVYLGLDGELIWGDAKFLRKAKLRSTQPDEADFARQSVPEETPSDEASTARVVADVDEPKVAAADEPETGTMPPANEDSATDVEADEANPARGDDRRARTAAGKLRLAKSNLERRNERLEAMAKRLLTEIVEDYGDTPAAGEAKELLGDLGVE